MQVKTDVKAGGINLQHNEAQVRAAARGLKVETGVKAGAGKPPSDPPPPPPPGLTVQTGVRAGDRGRECDDWQCGSNHNEVQVRPVGLKVQTDVKAGAAGPIKNHNHVQVRPTGLKVQTGVKAGGIQGANHSEAQVRAGALGLAVQTDVKAGAGGVRWGVNHNETQVPALKVQSSVRAGMGGPKNHNDVQVRGLKVQSGVKAGLYRPPRRANKVSAAADGQRLQVAGRGHSRTGPAIRRPLPKNEEIASCRCKPTSRPAPCRPTTTRRRCARPA